jgi:hypothetical protein
MLSGEFWKLEKTLLQEAIYNKRNLRMTVEGEWHQMRAGCLWQDLPVCLAAGILSTEDSMCGHPTSTGAEFSMRRSLTRIGSGKLLMAAMLRHTGIAQERPRNYGAWPKNHNSLKDNVDRAYSKSIDI